MDFLSEYARKRTVKYTVYLLQYSRVFHHHLSTITHTHAGVRARGHIQNVVTHRIRQRIPVPAKRRQYAAPSDRRQRNKDYVRKKYV